METLFHLSLPCTNAEETKRFYIETVGAVLGRHSNNWVDINLFGHQITFTQAAKFNLIILIMCSREKFFLLFILGLF